MERHPATVWEAIADEIGDAEAFVQGDRRVTWVQFEDRAARLAAAWQAAGLSEGSKVGLFLYNSPEYMEGMFAALKIRAVPVNVNYRYVDDELAYLLDNAEAEALIFHASLGGRVARVADRLPGIKSLVSVDDGAPLIDLAVAHDDVLAAHDPAPRITRDPKDLGMTYTGGTTGLPKGVMGRVGTTVDVTLVAVPPTVGEAPLSEPNDLPAFARRLLDEGRQIVSLPACPLMHGTGMAIGAAPVTTAGGKVVFLTSRSLDCAELWDLVEGEAVSSVVVVGDAFARPMLRELNDGRGRDLASVRLVSSSGAMFSHEVKAGLLEHIPQATIIDYIAATEGLMGMSLSRHGAVMPTGCFMPSESVKVLDDAGGEVEAGSGQSGMVAISGIIPLGYYKDEAKTAETFREIGGVRYSIPGDHAVVNADGTIQLLGRGSVCVNTGGEKVYPEEVEEVIKCHPWVDDCVVVGLPDERFGQRVAAVASPAPGVDQPDADAVLASTREQLAPYKVPRELRWVDEVPRAPNGKADYPAARDLLTSEMPSTA